MRIYVGNLSYRTEEDNLRELFSQHGDVAEVAIMTDRETGRSRGFGFVTMAESHDDHSESDHYDSLTDVYMEKSCRIHD